MQRTDSLAILTTVRELTQLELVTEALRLALEAVAGEEQSWLQAHVPGEWLRLYGAWTQDERLIREKGERASAEAQRLLTRTGQDGFALLEAEDAASLRGLPAGDVLRTGWSQQYQRAAVDVSPGPASPPPASPTLGVPKGVKPNYVKMLPASSVDDGQRGRVIVTPHDIQSFTTHRRAGPPNGGGPGTATSST